MQKVIVSIVSVLVLAFIMGCAGTSQVAHTYPSSPVTSSSPGISNISDGLPQDGLWRQNTALSDMNGDGFLDIVAPPPRKAKEGEERPFIFLWDNDGKRWKEEKATFPGRKFGYGGIAAGDLNGDGLQDIVLGTHTGGIFVLENKGKDGFVEKPFHLQSLFFSRTVEIADVNGDRRPDIVAISEQSFSETKRYKPKGILVGLNKGDGDWDVRTIEGSEGLSGNSFAVGDLRGSGKKDIVIAEENGSKKLVWFGDGKGDFKAYEGSFIGDTWPLFVGTGDIDGSGKDAAVFKLITKEGLKSRVILSAYSWNGESFADISAGLDKADKPLVFDLADLDGDGKEELVVLSEAGISVFKYAQKKWERKVYYPIPSESETKGVYGLKAARNRDGSALIVYNLGSHENALGHGIRAFILK